MGQGLAAAGAGGVPASHAPCAGEGARGLQSHPRRRMMEAVVRSCVRALQSSRFRRLDEGGGDLLRAQCRLQHRALRRAGAQLRWRREVCQCDFVWGQQHDLSIFDEIVSEMVLQQRKVFQASHVPLEFRHSARKGHVYSVHLHRERMVVCSVGRGAFHR